MNEELSRIIRFFEKLESEGDEIEMLRYESGTLSTKGCTGDYGCCSQQIDVIGMIDTLRKLRDITK